MTALGSLAHSRLVAAMVFSTLILGSVAAIAMSIADVLDRRQALTESEDLLDRLRARGGRDPANASDAALQGSPFLEGPTLTVAGATLLQRVAGAVANAGGTLQSSQIDVGEANRGGMIGLSINCEVNQPSLQGLLYDIEAGVPFLSIDQLDVAAPQAPPANATTPMRMRLVLKVSGQWRGRP